MADIEKVIKGLTKCKNGGFFDCEPCPYEETEKSCCIDVLLGDALEVLKEQEDLGTELTNAVELIHKKNERIEKLLKEQEQKEIKAHKKHVITWKRDDEFAMRRLYEAICETLLDEGELFIARTDDHEKVDFVFYVAEGR